MIYAAYQGETPLTVDNLEKVSAYLKIRPESVKWKASPVGRRRAGESGLIIIKFEEEE